MISNKRRVRSARIVLSLLLTCALDETSTEMAQAANSQKTKIHASFVVAVEKDRETQGKGYHYYDIELTLSGKNHFDEIYTQSYGSKQDSTKATETLGSNLWRVAGRNTLIRTYKWPNNSEIITINVNGSNCDAQWESRLNPGADEHLLYSTYYSALLHYRSATMFSSTCKIESAGDG